MRNKEKEISLFEATTAKLYQKQYQRFGCMTFNKMRTIVIYSVVTVVTWCQSGADGRGLDCQSCGWQIESQLGQINKKAFIKILTLKLLGLSDRDLNLEAPCTIVIS